MTPFGQVYGREATTMLDAMLPHVNHGISDVAPFLQRAEEARELARVRITSRQHSDASRYGIRRRNVKYATGDHVWLWTPIRQRSLSEKFLRRYFGPYLIVRSIGDLNYDVVLDGARQ